MSDSPLNCDLPVTDIEQQLEKRWYRTHGERLASPPARKVVGVSDSSEDQDYGVAYICGRFLDIRTAFSGFRRAQLLFINLFMMALLLLVWVVDVLFSGKALQATATFLVPMWGAVYLFEIFFPLTLPVRIDRQEGVVYVGHRGTFYRIPWEEMEVSFSHNLQYLGSGVMWERQYYSHIYLREKYYFCGKVPKSSLLRKKISSTFNEEMMYQRWNFIVRYFNDGVTVDDEGHLYGANLDSYNRYMADEPRQRFIGYALFSVFLPAMFWWKISPFKYKWPREIESIFGKNNYY
ncbi:hypothetical protein [Marinobacter mobilis]|uniref:Uncharacterized protein n=1 Tax=Marinobacter mobilis TaxID=488533 RepID=A0A1H2YPU2_9GAMM|nr:hypothetical protein [Marinobacter mobilis]SDX06539.1 hypothetical protein SAMN04487960_1065 [Marinobacter mobilis]